MVQGWRCFEFDSQEFELKYKLIDEKSLLIGRLFFLGLSGEFVSNTPHTVKVFRMFAVRFKMLSEIGDEIVNGSGRSENIITPNLVHDFFSADGFSFS